ncbi:hypothetical protein CRENBAI_019761 [Crenichthys baileyi]|uniref:Uncharacterized protein n=1 Tax=Crenichthys baileyi TaxID=28760 RepID=A0AAV9SRC6_9TELE
MGDVHVRHVDNGESGYKTDTSLLRNKNFLCERSSKNYFNPLGPLGDQTCAICLFQSVIFYRLFHSGSQGAGAYLQQSMGEWQGTPWTGRQSIAGQHTNNQAHTHSYT